MMSVEDRFRDERRDELWRFNHGPQLQWLTRLQYGHIRPTNPGLPAEAGCNERVGMVALLICAGPLCAIIGVASLAGWKHGN